MYFCYVYYTWIKSLIFKNENNSFAKDHYMSPCKEQSLLNLQILDLKLWGMKRHNADGGSPDHLKLQSPAVSVMKYLDIILHNFTKKT